MVRALYGRMTLRMRYRTAAMRHGDPPKESLIDPYHLANLSCGYAVMERSNSALPPRGLGRSSG